jgi:hypothetical protein
MGKLTVLALWIVVVALLGGSVFVQTVMGPLLAQDLTEGDPDTQHLKTPLVVIIVLCVLCAQVVLVCTGRLLTMVKHGTVFSGGAFRYVDIVIGAFLSAALFVFVAAALLAPGDGVPPGFVLLVGGAGVTVIGVALVVLVVRTLLAQAVDRDAEAARLRSELDEVI